jgi:hypothetical protein
VRKNLIAALGGRVDPSARVRVSDVPYRPVQQKSAAEQTPLQRIVFPPYVYKLPGGRSQDFNRNNFAATLAAGVGSVVTPVSFAMPGTMKGYVQIMGVYVLSPTANTSVTFSLRINGSPVSGWDNIQNPPGVANFFVQNFADLQVEVAPGADISIVATNNNANGPWTVGAKVAGWYHTEADERYFYGEP